MSPWARLGAIVRELDDDAARARAERPGFDMGPPVAFVVTALALVFMEYAGTQRVLGDLLEALERQFPGFLYGPRGLTASRWFSFVDLGYWAGIRIAAFLLFPVLAIRLLLRERIRDHGLRLGSLPGHMRAYLLILAVVLPPVLLSSLRPEFRAYYPFYRNAHLSWLDFGLWELLYAAQFFALEFFFRGFWLTATRRAFGSHAAYAMMVPYCMIHFTKPLLEVLGAIVAGIVLGLLAMHSRSIWGGVLVHVVVAVTMDVCALLGGPGLPTRLWP